MATPVVAALCVALADLSALDTTVSGLSSGGVIVLAMAEPRVLVIVAGTAHGLVKDVTKALTDVSPERIITIQYRVSRILGLTLQHHALIVLRPE
jgi:hypothetical protein